MTTGLLLALTIWLEARDEPFEGKLAVAQVVMERVADSRWPDTVREVILQPKQFTCWNGRTPSTAQVPAQPDEAWTACCAAARAVLMDSVFPDGFNHYYNPKRCSPLWAKRAKRTIKINNHLFLEL